MLDEAAEVGAWQRPGQGHHRVGSTSATTTPRPNHLDRRARDEAEFGGGVCGACGPAPALQRLLPGPFPPLTPPPPHLAPLGPLAPPPRPGSESRSASAQWGQVPARASCGCGECGALGRSGQFLAGAMSQNLRTALIFGGFISLIGAAFYPIYFRPLMRLEEYRE